MAINPCLPMEYNQSSGRDFVIWLAFDEFPTTNVSSNDIGNQHSPRARVVYGHKSRSTVG